MCTRVLCGEIVPEKSWYGLLIFEQVDNEWSYGKDLGDAQVIVTIMMANTTTIEDTGTR